MKENSIHFVLNLQKYVYQCSDDMIIGLKTRIVVDLQIN